MKWLMVVVCALAVVGCRARTRMLNVELADTPEARRCLAEAEASFTRCRPVGSVSTCMRLRNNMLKECPMAGPGQPGVKHEPLPQLPGWHP